MSKSGSGLEMAARGSLGSPMVLTYRAMFKTTDH